MDTTTAGEKASDLQEPLQDKEILLQDQALIGRQERPEYHHYLEDRNKRRNIRNPPRKQIGNWITQLSHSRTQITEEIATTLNN